jgi:hypothetical protein
MAVIRGHRSAQTRLSITENGLEAEKNRAAILVSAAGQ